jgi:hypothetical protein
MMSFGAQRRISPFHAVKRSFLPRRILWGGHGACPERNNKIIRGVHPEPNDEILHFVQNDKARGSE